MNYEFMLAKRYLRSRRDERFVSLISWSSGIGVGIGVAALIIVLSVMNGFDHELKDKILGFSAHVDIQGPENTMGQWQGWLSKVEKLPHVEQAAPYITAQVMAVQGSRTAGCILKGIDATREKQLASMVTEGKLEDLNTGSHPFRLIIGYKLARKLGVNMGDMVNIISPAGGVTPSGVSPRLRAFEVVGLFKSGFHEYDIGMMMTSLEAVQRLNRLGDQVTGIEVHLSQRDEAQVIAAQAKSILPLEAWITDWTQRNKSFFEALKMERVVMGIILSLIVLVAVFNMVASLVMVVMERRKEIAVLKTVGATHRSIIRIFLYMGAILSGVGTLLGATFGLLVAWKLSDMILWIEELIGKKFMSGDVYYIDHVPSIIDPYAVGLIVVFSFTLGLLATLYPAWRASLVPPADALRYE
ncbi:MAG: lipoprotein-releasing ABC transporter permease subunit [Mariprofundaceae bacterium]|nr:lipoprotein-releasing ABC transporter permease subunit [Mariprofundaceae bacterium]